MQYKIVRYFYKKMKDFKPYLIEFELNGAIKPKVYFFDCAINNNKQ